MTQYMTRFYDTIWIYNPKKQHPLQLLFMAKREEKLLFFFYNWLICEWKEDLLQILQSSSEVMACTPFLADKIDKQIGSFLWPSDLQFLRNSMFFQ